MSAASRDKAREAKEYLEEAESNARIAKEKFDEINDPDGSKIAREAEKKAKAESDRVLAQVAQKAGQIIEEAEKRTGNALQSKNKKTVS